jgi:hypothetical protein
MSAIDYLGEGKIHDRLVRELVRESAHDEFIAEYRQNKFDENTLDQWIEEAKVRVPHRFVGGGDREKADDLARSAFLFGNVTDQGRYTKQYGMEAAIAAAKRFENPFPFEHGKPGKESDADKAANKDKPGGEKNPWRGDLGHVFSPAEVTAQMNFLKVLLKAHPKDEALRRANQVANVYGCEVGSTRVGQRQKQRLAG